MIKRILDAFAHPLGRIGLVIAILVVLSTAVWGIAQTQPAPGQPTDFPHRLHLGLGVECLYCHPGAWLHARRAQSNLLDVGLGRQQSSDTAADRRRDRLRDPAESVANIGKQMWIWPAQSRPRKKRNRKTVAKPPFLSAERAGFEPAFPFGKHALQACALNQTTRPLQCPKNGRIISCGFSGPSLTLGSLLLRSTRRDHPPSTGTEVQDLQYQVGV
jgi:hypothetical protein